MPFAGFSENTLRFLAELAQNNERAWFEAHRHEYERFVVEPAQAFVQELGARLRELDPKIQAIPRVRGSIKALERRMRFPRSTAPLYTPHVDLWFWSGRRRAWDNSGFFIRLGHERMSLAAGMIEFQKETLARYREQVVDEDRGVALATIVNGLRAQGYVVAGESYKKTPPGVPSDHPRAVLSKHGGLFAVWESQHPPELATAAFTDLCFGHCARMARLHAWLAALR